MNVIKWFLWYRWLFLKNSRGLNNPKLLSNCWKINLGKCREHTVIWRDMQRIIHSRTGADE